MNFMKQRKSQKLYISSLITMTAGGTRKNTFLIDGKLRKKGFIVFCDLPTIKHMLCMYTQSPSGGGANRGRRTMVFDGPNGARRIILSEYFATYRHLQYFF